MQEFQEKQDPSLPLSNWTSDSETPRGEMEGNIAPYVPHRLGNAPSLHTSHIDLRDQSVADEGKDDLTFNI
jgi:hypothetical protein